MLTKFFRRSKPNRKPVKLNLVSLEARDVPATFTVINTNDAGIGSLRQAVLNANGTAGADTIAFSATFNTAKTISLTSGQILITEGLTINGPGSELLTIRDGGASRILNFDSPLGAQQTLNLTGVTLRDGSVLDDTGGAAVRVNGERLTAIDVRFLDNAAASGSRGGAVYGYFNSNLTFQNCEFDGNTSFRGGAIGGDKTIVSLLDTTVTNNAAVDSGGGIFLFGNGSLAITASTIMGNSAGGSGGGIELFEAALAVVDSLIAANTASSSAGGVYFSGFQDDGYSADFRNTTLSGNLAKGTPGSGGGGGIEFVIDQNDVITFENCTISNNTAVAAGGGIESGSFFPTNISFESTIVAGNVAASGPDVASNSPSPFGLKASAIGNASGFSYSDLGGNFINVSAGDLKLAPLADNGGNRLSHALAIDSPIRNKGTNPNGSSTDVRGAGYHRVTNGQADIGAYETRQQFVVTNNQDSGTGSLRQALIDANAFVSSGDLITFDPVYFNVARQITLLNVGLQATDTVEIDGPGPQLLTVNCNKQVNGFSFSSGTTSVLRGVTVKNSTQFAVHTGTDAFTMDNCALVNNTSSVITPGLYASFNTEKLIVSNSLIANNVASDGGNGGGIIVESHTGTFTLLNSTVSNNSSSTDGGGVRASGAVEIINSTISSNTAATFGAGLLLTNLSAPAKIINSTIANNTAGTQGGGVHIGGTPNQSLELVSSVIAGNSAPSANDIFTFHVTTPVNARSSAVGSLAGIAKFNDLGGNIAPGTDLKLSPLANTGGLGSTHAPRPGSPLLNSGSNPFNLATDQRGLPRSFQGGVDIGAVEAQIAPQIEVTVDSGKDQRSRVRSLTATFDRTVTLGPLAFDLVRQGPDNPSGPLDILVDTSLSTATQTIATITWNDPDFTQHGSLIDGDYFLAAFQGDITDANGLHLDGNGDGNGGDTGITFFHRLFGDSNGDRTVDGSTDFAAFGNCFGTSFGEATFNDAFDFNDDGTIDGSTDFAQFGARFGLTL